MKSFIKDKLQWMSENLAVTKDREGNELILGKDYWYPNGYEKNEKEYGLLYTWDAALRACPKGWRLPTIEELSEKIVTSTEFNAITAGYFSGSSYNGFYNFSTHAYLWISTDIDNLFAQSIILYDGPCIIYKDKSHKGFGFSVRCVRDVKALD